jgi:hypothetical protein
VKAWPKPLATLVALVGLAAFAWGLHHLLLIGSCGGDNDVPCPPGSGKYFVGVAAGITVAILGTVAGGGAFTFIAIFLTIGLTSIVTGLSDAGAESREFLYLFGGIFTAVALGPLLIAPFVLARRRRAAALIEHGSEAVGTVMAVHDTNVTVNNNPRVRLDFRIEPQDGTPAFEASKSVTVSRVEIPRPGDRYPVWFDPSDHDRFAFGTDVTSQATPGVRRLFAAAGRAAGPTIPAPAELAAPAGAAAEDDPIARLGKLNELRLAGALTDAEFKVQKDRLLERMSSG